MKSLLWLIPALPFTGATILILFGSRMPRRAAGFVGTACIGLSAIVTFFVGNDFLSGGEKSFTQLLWNWIYVGDFSPDFALYLDALSLVFIFVITFVGFLIHVYSVEFMADDDGMPRFFAYLNLFVSAMLILVLADNLMLLLLGWEGVGLCSYLLIGFWYQEEKNGYAARKAFIVTRVGDTALVVALFMLFQNFNTLNIQVIADQAMDLWVRDPNTVFIIAMLLLGGAVGKSAQLPLQTWLPDAMAGPSPVSALIHAATMVTAGVYLIVRMHIIFEVDPLALQLVGGIGAATLLLAGFAALTQWDLKRVLAYSTISQIGYMFLALGVGAWSAAIFHFMIHAFFKALLFLAAGAVIKALHHEHDMFKMGGLKKKLPVIYWTFLIGASSLAALPLVTAGFYSKDQILWLAFAGNQSNIWFFIAAMVGAFITSIYTFRMVFITFSGEERTHVSHPPSDLITIPLLILAGLSLVGGFFELPHTMGHLTLLSDFLSPVLWPVLIRDGAETMELGIQVASAVVALSGVYVAYLFYVKKPELADKAKASGAALHRFWLSGWGFDAVYDTLLVKPFVFLANVNKQDVIDKVYGGVVEVAEGFHRFFAFTQSGILRWYVMGIVIGGIIVLTLGLLIQ